MGGCMIKTKKPKQVSLTEPPKNYTHHNGILDRWTEPQIRLLQNIYQKAKGSLDGLDFAAFLKVFPLLEVFPASVRQTAFSAFAPKPTIGFREFCFTLSQILHSNQDDQAAFLFRMFDVDEDQVLSSSELQVLFTSCSSFLKTQSPLPEGRVDLDQFRLWAKSTISLAEALACFEVVPTPEEERKVIQGSLKLVRDIEPGTEVYLLSAKWWEAWTTYVHYNERRSVSPPRTVSTLVGDRPIEIENDELFEHDSPTGALRRGLKEGSDFIVLTEMAWNALHSWYGGGPPLKRTVVQPGERVVGLQGERTAVQPGERKSLQQGERKVDLYPPIVRAAVQFRRASKKETSVILSTGCTMVEAQAQIQKALDVKAGEQVRFWLKIGSEWKQLHHFENPDLHGKEVVVEVADSLNGRVYWPMDQRLALEGNWREFKNGGRVDVQRAPNLWVEAVVISSTNTHVKVRLMRENQYEEFPKNSEDLSAPGTKTPALAPLTHPAPMGAKGLANLGNTCYISCILQCVSNTPLLRDYLRNKKNHGSHINTSNPNGFKGAMALEVSNIIHDLWESRRPVLSPAPFHKALSKCFLQFQGHNQHDCHELLGVLLDSLHEDLSRGSGPQNSITLKNPVSGQEDQQAEQQWKELQGAQGSAISDLMGGQTKTTLRCKKCGDTSVLFELFMHLALPLPVSTAQALTFVLFPANSKIVKYGLQVPKGSNLQALATRISEVTGIAKDCFLLGDLYMNRINSFYDSASQDSLRRQGINSRTELVVYETETSLVQYERLAIQSSKPPIDCEPGDRIDIEVDSAWVPAIITNSKVTSQTREFQVTYFFKEMATQWILQKSPTLAQYRSKSRVETDRLLRFHVLNRKANENARPEVVGVPFLVTIGNWLTQQDLLDLISNKLLRFIRSPSKRPSASAASIKSDDSSLRKADSFKKPYVLKMLNRGGVFCYMCGARCSGCEFPVAKTSLAALQGQNTFSVGVDWIVGTYNFDFVEDESVRAAQALESKNSTPLELRECIDAFTKEEELDGECENCKNRGISMKMDVWRLPDILILTLKRFAYFSGAPEKIDQSVDYPLTGLDLSPWVRRFKNSNGLTQSTTALQSAYDLYAVVHHSGSMEGGHYTTCCLHEFEGRSRWLLYDDEQVLEVIGDLQKTIVSKNAYLLFYRRRKLSTSNLLLEAPLQGQCLLLPALSVGNTGQLALDLLLNTSEYGFRKVGWIHTPLLLPAVGHQPLDWSEKGALAYPAEVYSNGSLLVLQLRSILISNSHEDFVSALFAWASSLSVTEVVVLASNAAANRPHPEAGRVYCMRGERSQRSLSLPTQPFNPELMMGVGILKKLLKRRDTIVTALVCYSDWQVDVGGSYELLRAFLTEWGLPTHEIKTPTSWQGVLV